MRYVRSSIVEFATSGDEIRGLRTGTLSGFLSSDGKLYGLTAKHVAGDIGKSCCTKDDLQLGVVAKVSKKLDVAVILVDKPNEKHCDLSLKDEGGNSLKRPCYVRNVSKDLDYIRSAVT